jgi:hypothetical protein
VSTRLLRRLRLDERPRRPDAPGDCSYAPTRAVHESIPSNEGALLFIVETP